MLQESVGWDPRYMTREPSTSLKIYMLFLFVACFVVAIKLIRIWRAAPPFRLSRQAGNPTYLQSLQASSTSLKQWIGCTFLGWGILFSISLHKVCDRLLDDESMGRFAILFAIQDFATTLTMALLVAVFLFLVRWHMLDRMERLRNMPDYPLRGN